VVDAVLWALGVVVSVVVLVGESTGDVVLCAVVDAVRAGDGCGGMVVEAGVAGTGESMLNVIDVEFSHPYNSECQ
jgi:hypothetical protein